MKNLNPEKNSIPQANASVQGAGSAKGGGFDDAMISATDGKLANLGAQRAKSSSEIGQPKSLLEAELFKPEDLMAVLDLRPNYKVAEFGCGTGNISIELAKRLSSGEVYGVDVQKDLLLKMLRRAKEENLNNLMAVWGDIDQMGGSKLPDLSFDMVLMVNTFFQLENKDIAVKEAHRILKPGAKLVIVDWSKKDLPLGPSKDQFVSREEIIETVTSNAFIFSDEQEMRNFHIKLSFNKI